MILGVALRKINTSSPVPAGYLNIGTRFLSDLENGKPTVQLEKVLHALNGLGFKVIAVPKASHKLIRYIELFLQTYPDGA